MVVVRENCAGITSRPPPLRQMAGAPGKGWFPTNQILPRPPGLTMATSYLINDLTSEALGSKSRRNYGGSQFDLNFVS
jgi:hypothetical protein